MEECRCRGPGPVNAVDVQDLPFLGADVRDEPRLFYENLYCLDDSRRNLDGEKSSDARKSASFPLWPGFHQAANVAGTLVGALSPRRKDPKKMSMPEPHRKVRTLVQLPWRANPISSRPWRTHPSEWPSMALRSSIRGLRTPRRGAVLCHPSADPNQPTAGYSPRTDASVDRPERYARC